jgi:hypothetical protein
MSGSAALRFAYRQGLVEFKCLHMMDRSDLDRCLLWPENDSGSMID